MGIILCGAKTSDRKYFVHKLDSALRSVHVCVCVCAGVQR